MTDLQQALSDLMMLDLADDRLYLSTNPRELHMTANYSGSGTCVSLQFDRDSVTTLRDFLTTWLEHTP